MLKNNTLAFLHCGGILKMEGSFMPVVMLKYSRLFIAPLPSSADGMKYVMCTGRHSGIHTSRKVTLFFSGLTGSRLTQRGKKHYNLGIYWEFNNNIFGMLQAHVPKDNCCRSSLYLTHKQRNEQN
jgi:hypothetical protein